MWVTALHCQLFVYYVKFIVVHIMICFYNLALHYVVQHV